MNVFPNQRSALSGLAVGYVFMYLCFQPAISLEQSSCWTCTYVCVFPNQRSVMSSLAGEDMYVMSVFFIEILYVVCNNIIIDMLFRTTVRNSISQIDDLCSSKDTFHKIYLRN